MWKINLNGYREIFAFYQTNIMNVNICIFNCIIFLKII